MSSCQRWSNREFRKIRFSLPGQTSNHLTERHTLPRHPTHSGPPPYQKTCSARRHATHQVTGHSAPLLSSSCLSPQHGLSCIERAEEARQDVRCSMDAPAREYRPARFPLVDIAHLGPRVKGRVLPNSPKSAPLTGGRFRRPAKTHEGTPSGAHFSHRCRVWRPAGGPRECRDAGCVYGSPPA